MTTAKRLEHKLELRKIKRAARPRVGTIRVKTPKFLADVRIPQIQSIEP